MKMTWFQNCQLSCLKLIRGQSPYLAPEIISLTIRNCNVYLRCYFCDLFWWSAKPWFWLLGWLIIVHDISLGKTCIPLTKCQFVTTYEVVIIQALVLIVCCYIERIIVFKFVHGWFFSSILSSIIFVILRLRQYITLMCILNVFSPPF